LNSKTYVDYNILFTITGLDFLIWSCWNRQGWTPSLTVCVLIFKLCAYGVLWISLLKLFCVCLCVVCPAFWLNLLTLLDNWDSAGTV